MARSNQSFRRGLSRSTARRPSWSQGPEGIVTRTASGQSLLTGAQANVDELTVIRTRGILDVIMTAGAAALDGYDGAVGICVVSENAFNAGVGSVPSPTVDIAWDGWLWYQMIHVKTLTTTFADGVNAQSVVARYIIDSKVMRKTNLSDVIVVVIDVAEVGTATATFHLDTRLLIKQMN